MSKVSMILNMISLQKKFLVRAAQLGVRNISMSSALRKNHYETLGVPRDATQAEIKNAYFELSKLYHPDRIAATDENLAKFREVSAAYEILGNEQSRKLYDRGLLDLAKPGEEEEIADPIIKFYKQRQEVSRQQAKAGDDLDAWAQTYFAEAKKRATKQHQLYTASKRPEEDGEKEEPLAHTFQMASLIVLAFLIASNFENSRAHRLWKTVTFW